MIIASAVKFYKSSDIRKKFPQIKTGYFHNQIHDEMFIENIRGSIDYDKFSIVDGFLTDDIQFLDRYEAALHAIKCGQLDEEYFYGDIAPNLFDEDLFGEEVIQIP